MIKPGICNRIFLGDYKIIPSGNNFLTLIFVLKIKVLFLQTIFSKKIISKK